MFINNSSSCKTTTTTTHHSFRSNSSSFVMDLSRNIGILTLLFLIFGVDVIYCEAAGKVVGPGVAEERDVDLPGGGWEQVTVIPINGNGKVGNNAIGNKAIDQMAQNILQNVAQEESSIVPTSSNNLQTDMSSDSTSLFKDAQEMEKDGKNTQGYKQAQADLEKKSLQLMNDFSEEMGLGQIPKSAIQTAQVTVTKQLQPNGGTQLSQHDDHDHDLGDYEDDDEGDWHHDDYSHIATHPNQYMVPAQVGTVDRRESALSGLEIFLLALLVGALVYGAVRQTGLASKLQPFFQKEEQDSYPRSVNHKDYENLVELGDGYQTLDDETHPL